MLANSRLVRVTDERVTLRYQDRRHRQCWKVIRFRDKDVEVDVEAVARAIARVLNLEYEFRRHKATGQA